MTGILSILTQQLAEAQTAGDLPRQIALASAMLKERVSDADRLYLILAEACRELVIRNDPSDLNAVLGWYQTWYRHTRDPAVRHCIDATNERVAVVIRAEKELNNAVEVRDTVALRAALDALMATPDRLTTTNLLIEQGEAVLAEQLIANKRALTDRIKRSTVLRRTIERHIPNELDLASEAYTTLLGMDPTAAEEPALQTMSERMAALRRLHTTLESAMTVGALAPLIEATAALESHAERMSTTAALLEHAQREKIAREEHLAQLHGELAAANRQRPDQVVPLLEALTELDPEGPAKKELDSQQRAWGDLRAWHATIGARHSVPLEQLEAAVKGLRGSSAHLSDSNQVMQIGEQALRQSQQASRQKIMLRVGLGSAAAIVIIGIFVLMWRDSSSYQAITTAQDPTQGLALADAYPNEGHLFYHQDVLRVRERLAENLATKQLADLASMKVLPDRLPAIERKLAQPELKQCSAFIDLRDQTLLEMDDQEFARINALADNEARMAALKNYAQQTKDTPRAEQARRTITSLIRARDDQAWTAVQLAKTDNEKLIALEMYLALPQPAKQTEAIAMRSVISMTIKKQEVREADQARWQAALAITDPTAGIAAIERYLKEPGQHADAASARLRELRRQLDDQAWETASVPGTPVERSERARAYLQRPGERAHASKAQAALAQATWDTAHQHDDFSTRLVSMQAYLADPANQAFRADAERLVAETIIAIDDSLWQQALATPDKLARLQAIEKFISSPVSSKSPTTRHQQDAVEMLASMTRELISEHPEVVVKFPLVVLTRVPVSILGTLTSDHMAQLPLPLQLRIPMTPRWSVSAGVDAYGRWAVLPIGKHQIRLRYLPAGSVMSSAGKPIRVVESFWLAETETPQIMWTEFMGGFFSNGNPSLHRGDDLPVHRTSRVDCDRFMAACNERLKLENRNAMVRLPTLAEWRYTAISAVEGVEAVARGTARGYDTRDLVRLAYAAENGSTPTAVGGGRRDQWGLSDMLGNVGEWVADTNQDGAWWCGGAWTMPRAACLPETINNSATQVTQDSVGLRLVVTDVPLTTIAQP